MQLFCADIFGILRLIDQLINNTFAALNTQYIAAQAKVALALVDFNIEAFLDIFHVVIIFAKHGFKLCWSQEFKLYTAAHGFSQAIILVFG